MLELKDRIEKYIPMDDLEAYLKELYLRNVSVDQINYESGLFQGEIRAERNLNKEEMIRKFRTFINASLDNRYLPTEWYIPEGKTLYCRKFPRYMAYNTHYHKDAVEINLVLLGEFTIFIGTEKFVMKPGDLCFISPNIRHGAKIFDDRTIVMRITVYQRAFRNIIDVIGPGRNLLHAYLTKMLYGGTYYPYLFCRTGFDEDVAGMTIDLEESADIENEYADTYMKVALNFLIVRLLIKHSDHMFAGKEIAKNEFDILNIMDYMEANYTTITLETLARTYNYNASYLSTLIRAQYGKSYSELMTEIRLRKAEKLLRETDYGMTKIAETVGYSDKSYFLKRFKKQYGITPLEFRQQAKNL